MPLAHVYLAPGFEEVEALTIVDVLRRAGVETLLVALDDQLSVTGAHDVVVQADRAFAAVEGQLADAIVLPGGPGAEALAAHPGITTRLRAHQSAGKHVAAICAAPSVLSRAGVLEGRKATCFPGYEEKLRAGGAEYAGYNVVQDGQFTTGRGPATAGLFALELARQLAGEEAALKVGRAMLYV
ncbi:DJ-1 family glyoxalase III [Chitiniphilus eburneus]|uniref:DJ-1/PfpI family protein n=1 Tax=Chitiniphilus eburneus TaxID=2571148 RepID=A0A4V5MPS0_9NEIS|nr:DJ-1 family glyoxalase III [Chitiniphilus eburneus]TJZ69778.1 DJ-1/PfpI family protein [Chitiniphilus eburneus]